MLSVFTLYKRGFNNQLSIGDIFDHDNHLWAIVKITNVKREFSWNRNQELVINVIAQKEGTYEDVSGLEQISNITERFILSKDENPFGIGYTFYGEGTEILSEITSIQSFRYEFTDLLVDYEYEILREYSLIELNKLMKKERLKKFKVI